MKSQRDFKEYGMSVSFSSYSSFMLFLCLKIKLPCPLVSCCPSWCSSITLCDKPTATCCTILCVNLAKPQSAISGPAPFGTTSEGLYPQFSPPVTLHLLCCTSKEISVAPGLLVLGQCLCTLPTFHSRAIPRPQQGSGSCPQPHIQPPLLLWKDWGAYTSNYGKGVSCKTFSHHFICKSSQSSSHKIEISLLLAVRE